MPILNVAYLKQCLIAAWSSLQPAYVKKRKSVHMASRIDARLAVYRVSKVRVRVRVRVS